MADETLISVVRQAQQGDTRAFDVLVRRFQNMAVAYARTLLRNPVAAEDAAQDAFVQAWCDLHSLSDASAFASWLRRIVFKYCDRATRSVRPTVSLDYSMALPDDLSPVAVAERAHDAATIRTAIDALPCTQREITLLYYLSGHDTGEIAAFLELPISTVKNRLFAARKRLRKDLWTMAETLLEEARPSQNTKFADNVLVRVLREFERQEAADPHSANRGLLDEGRTALFQTLATSGPLDTQTAHDGFILLWRQCDFQALSTHLMRYLNQSLSDSETAWAYVHLANAIAISGSAAGAILAHETFERWLPGKTPILSANWPYNPLGEPTASAHYAGDEVRLLFLGQSAEFTTSYRGAWRNNDYLAKVDNALAEIPITQYNCIGRFFMLRMACNASDHVTDFERAQDYIAQMNGLAAAAPTESMSMEIKAKALGHEMNLARLRNDMPTFVASSDRLTQLLNSAEETYGCGTQWIRGERHNLACELVRSNLYDRALPLLEANLASGGQVGGWGWMVYAATIWTLSRNRQQTLDALREARAHDDRDMTPLFVKCAEFADVLEDMEFVQAISRKK